MVTGISKEEATELIKVFTEELKSQLDVKILDQEKKYLDLADKYNSLMIEVRDMKKPKLNDESKNDSPSMIIDEDSDNKKSTRAKGRNRGGKSTRSRG
jgi:hypothetical protein